MYLPVTEAASNGLRQHAAGRPHHLRSIFSSLERKARSPTITHVPHGLAKEKVLDSFMYVHLRRKGAIFHCRKPFLRLNLLLILPLLGYRSPSGGRPILLYHSSSDITSTPSSRACSSFPPGFRPTTTTSVFREMDPVTRPPSSRAAACVSARFILYVRRGVSWAARGAAGGGGELSRFAVETGLSR